MSSEGINNPAKRRRVARACDTCRRKKVRCDGVQAGSDPPSCTNCKAYGYECAFIDAPKKRGPPKGYIEALETRLQRMESILGGLVQNGDIPEGTISTSNLEWINVDETNFAADKVEESSKDPSLQKSSSHDGSSRSTSFSSHRTDGYEHRHRSSDPNNPAYRSLSNSDSEESSSCGSKDEYGSSYDLNDSMGQLAIDETGQTRYLGNSSGIFLLKITNRVANGQIITVPRGEWQSSNKVNSTVYKLPSRELCDQMLDVYFTYVHPFLPFLDQHEVREKYAKLESNSSILLLLYAIFAIASRFIDQPAVRKDPNDPTTTGDGFFDQAKDLLKDEFDDAQLSTIHALLLMAAYQQGSKNSRAWLYIGLAIRTAQDMGLHRDSAKWSLDEKQTEIRKRAWWACYTFDRFISAGLGRPMTINESDCDVPFPVPGALPDDEKENVEAWIKTIKLAQILGRVLQHIYGIKSKHTTHAATDSVLASLDAELNTWRESLPASLQYDPSTPLADAKNHRHGHMHLMFYTIQILLHRPHIRGPKSKAPPSSIPSLTICTMAANNITHISYRSMKEGKLKIAWNFILYFFFTAAVMHVINALSGDDRFREVAKHGLRMSLKCLEYLKPFWFGAERCIFVIRDLLRVRNINLDGFNPNGTEHVDQNNNADGFETKVEGNIVTCLNSGTTGAQPKTQANSQHRVLFAPSASESPTTSPHVAATATDQYSQAIMQQMAAAAAAVVASQNTSNGAASNHSPNAQQSNQALAITNSSTSKQESSPQIPYEQSPSPASSSSSNSTSFMPFGDFMSTDNAFFPPNTDAFSADVNSVLFDEDDPMGTNNPFWAVPSTFDWNDWTDYMNGMHGLRATAATTAAASATSDIAAASLLSGVRGNVSLGSDVNNPQRIPHGL